MSSYLSGSSLSLHRRINSEYFNPSTDKSELATDALVWRPFSFKTNRVRSLTELYVRKNDARQSPTGSKADSLQQRNIDKLYQIYCTPKRPPLPVRYKKRNKPNSTVKAPLSEPAYHPVERQSTGNQQAGKDYLKPHNQFTNQFTNLHEVYTVRDAIVGPNIASYGEKEIQTSLEDFHDLDYDDEYAFESSPRFIDSSTNDEFESLAKTRNLSDDQHSERKIKRQLEINFSSLERERSELEREIDEVLEEEEELLKEEELLEKELNKEKEAIKELNESRMDENRMEETRIEEEDFQVAVHLLESTEKEAPKEEIEEKPNEANIEKPTNQEPINEKEIDKDQQINTQIDEEPINEETSTLNEDYVTVQDSSSRTIGPYLDARQGNTLTHSNEDQESTYVTLDCDRDAFDTDTLADLDSLNEAYMTPVNSGSLSNTISRPKRTKRRSQLRNSGLDTEDDDDDEITDEIIGIAANLQKELKQLVEKQKD